jgi:hypothetical protein
MSQSHGWGVPMSTDTAFAVALIAMLGSRVPRAGSIRPTSPTSLPSSFSPTASREARAHMDAYSLAAVGATFDEKPGFVLLADQFSLEGGGHAEDLQDYNCLIAHSTP